MSHRANFATVYVGAQLAPEEKSLDLDWATDAGDATAEHEFTVPSADVTDAHVGLQAFDVDAYGHEIVINGESLTGFDIPPSDGWQYWMDTLAEVDLREGPNTVQIRRDTDTADAFAVGTVKIQWKEPRSD